MMDFVLFFHLRTGKILVELSLSTLPLLRNGNSCTSSLWPNNSQNDAVYAMATNKEMVIRASSAVLSQLGLEELWISPMLVIVDTLSAVATTETYSASEGEVRVLIEWKRHKESLKSRPTDFKRLSTRVDNIAQTLHLMPKPEGFRTLRCLKSFDDTKEGRFGIVFETPPASDPHACSIPLRALYDQCKGDKQPLLRDKCRLASLIANSVCEFLCASWFHKSVNQHTILFFKNLEGVLDLCSPFLTGFEYSRLDQESEDTEPPDSDYLYQHPDYQNPEDRSDLGEASRLKYLYEYDIYAIGLVLFAWRSLEDFMQPEISRHILRQSLLQKYIPRLGIMMGAIYRDVVAACLSDKFAISGGQATSPREDFLRRARWHFVKRLEECKA